MNGIQKVSGSTPLSSTPKACKAARNQEISGLFFCTFDFVSSLSALLSALCRENQMFSSSFDSLFSLSLKVLALVFT
jgi:hypothetical protein